MWFINACFIRSCIFVASNAIQTTDRWNDLPLSLLLELHSTLEHLVRDLIYTDLTEFMGGGGLSKGKGMGFFCGEGAIV